MSYLKAKLLSTNLEASYLTRIILKIIKENNPESVEQLTKILHESLDLAEEEIVNYILKLQAEGIIRLQTQTRESRGFVNYLKTRSAIWYWLTIAIGTTTSILSFSISESIYPWFLARNLLGFVFILFLPGFAFIKVLFQSNKLRKTPIGGLEAIKYCVLSISLSIALVSIVGILLFYSPWGLNLITVVLGLFTLTSIFATAAVIREYAAGTGTE
jgi:DNA-binding Lrp family transcriptional regulator